MPPDRLPYIGRLRRTDDRLLVATGFAKWGLTKGVLRCRNRRDHINALQRGQGTVAPIGARYCAIHRDDKGELQAVSARCTHLGCLVGWNQAERTWEVPATVHSSQLMGRSYRDRPPTHSRT